MRLFSAFRNTSIPKNLIHTNFKTLRFSTYMMVLFISQLYFLQNIKRKIAVHCLFKMKYYREGEKIYQ